LCVWSQALVFMNYVFVSENLLVDWFILIHKKNMLVRRDAELVYM